MKGGLLGLLALALAALATARTGLPRRAIEARCFLPEIRRAARAERLDPWLLVSVARVESGFRPDAVSPKGARGLLQVMPETAREVAGPGPELDLADPATNLRLGARYLRVLLDRFGDTRQALAAYNGGPNAVAAHLATAGDTALARFSKAETRRYVERVTRTHRRLLRWAPALERALRAFEAPPGSTEGDEGNEGDTGGAA